MSASSNDKKKVIVFGATGAVGTALIQMLASQYSNWRILGVTRFLDSKSRLASLDLPNVTMVEGDPFNRESVIGLTDDCDLVYSCIGFHRYETKYWAANWPTVVDNLLAAVAITTSKGKDKQLCFCDNLYAYGSSPNTKIGPSSVTVAPTTTTKPGVRSILRTTLLDFIKAHPGQVTVVGGADFFGPHVTDKSFLGDTMTGKIIQGQSALAVGSSTSIHDFCCVSDFAAALATASTDSRAYDKFWICPHSIHNKTLQEIANDIAAIVNNNANDTSTEAQHQVADTVPVKIFVLNKLLLYMMCPFMSFAWEMLDMVEFWTTDYCINDSSFVETFGVTATPYKEALTQLVDFYKAKEEQA